jgi:hypothetical protein
MRLSPFNFFIDAVDSTPYATFTYLVEQLNKVQGLAYVHMVEDRPEGAHALCWIASVCIRQCACVQDARAGGTRLLAAQDALPWLHTTCAGASDAESARRTLEPFRKASDGGCTLSRNHCLHGPPYKCV